MGRKRTGTRKRIHLYIALLSTVVVTCLSLCGCASLDDSLNRSVVLKKLWPQDESHQHLLEAQKLLAQGDFETALEENMKVLALCAQSPPGDEALYNIGLIHAHPGNPKRDQAKAVSAFDTLLVQYTQSRWVEQARVWSDLIRECEELKQVPVVLKQTQEELAKVAAVTPQKPRDESRQRLIQVQKLLAQGDYEGALEENQKVLALCPQSQPGDEALYNIGLIYSHPGNPKRDHAKSIAAFKKLVKEYQRGPWAEQGKIWLQILQENESAKRVAATVTQENERLKQMIEESKKVDLEIEEKKREKAR
jgi:tetratricopeptide (TPR) repeat protein